MSTDTSTDVKAFDVDDAVHVEFRDRLAALIPDVQSGEELHPDKGRRLDA